MSRVLVLGITFKENCPDIRNTKVVDLVKELSQYQCKVDIYDPWANKEEVEQEFNLKLVDSYRDQRYSAIILAVAHNEFKDFDLSFLKKNNKIIIYDIKGYWEKALVDKRV